MTRFFMTGAMAVYMAASLTSQNAQDPPPATKPVRVSGCLASVIGPSGVLPNNALLNDASPVLASEQTKKMGKTETKNYELTAAPLIGLAKHIGHKVEIEGRVQPSPHGNPDKVPPQGGAHGLREHLVVMSVKHVSSSCR